MEKEKGMHFIADIRRRKEFLQEEISNAINKFRKSMDLKVIKVSYELEQEEGGLKELDESPIKPEEIHIRLEDI